MSEEKNLSGFVARWSRRKQEAAVESHKREDNDKVARPVKAGADKIVSQQQLPAPALDLTKLPPLESIDAQTDMRVFLQAGVPADLTRAALRRAWAADPAIRDFIGLSENSFDFNSPDLPGFGPLDPDFDVQAFATRVFEGSAENSPASPVTEGAKEGVEAGSRGIAPPANENEEEGSSSAEPARQDAAVAGPQPPETDHHDQPEINIAAQRDEQPPAVPAHRHGSALPKMIT